MNKLFKGKNQNTIPYFHIKQTKKDKLNIPHPNTNIVKNYKSIRPFGKDITNNFKNNLPIMPIVSFNQNQKVRKFFLIILIFR